MQMNIQIRFYKIINGNGVLYCLFIWLTVEFI